MRFIPFSQTKLRFKGLKNENPKNYEFSINNLSRYGKKQFKTLPTYVRNAIGHPYEKDKSGNRTGKKKEYNEDDLRTSIELMRKIQDNSPATSSQWLSWTFSARCDIMALC